MVFLFADYSGDSACNQEHSAGSAGRHLAIQCRSLELSSQLCCLADSILFGMDGSHAMRRHGPIFMRQLFDLMPFIIAVRHPWRGAYVSGDHNLVVLCYHAAASAPIAGSSFADGLGYFHEVFISRRADILFFSHFFELRIKNYFFLWYRLLITIIFCL
jgi:phytoene dehydrogenase-like protein